MCEISVVMPVFNGEEYLEESLNSILNQSYSDFEFIIVVEYGSSDKTIEILQKYANEDKRIILVFNQERLGISASLNIGFRMAKGAYIARMDADDISGVRRLEVQKKYLDLYPEIGVCGTTHTVIGAPHWLVDYHADPAQIKSELLFFVPMRHPTLMVRKSVIEACNLYYNEELPGAEDYDFLIRAARVTKLSNIKDKSLFAYRRSGNNISAVNIERDSGIRMTSAKNLLEEELQLSLSDEEIRILVITTCFENVEMEKYGSILQKLDDLLKKISEKNEQVHAYETAELNQTLIHRWHRARYTLDLKYNKKIPDALLKIWRSGTYYHPWLE